MVLSRSKLLDEDYPIDCDAIDLDYFFIRELDSRFRSVVDTDHDLLTSYGGQSCVPPEEARRFQQLLAKHPDGIPTLQLDHLYQQEFNVPLEVRAWGYRSISDLIFDNPSLFAIQNFDRKTAKLFPDYPTDYIIRDPNTFKASVTFDESLKLNTFRLVLEFNNRGERFPVRDFVEYYRYYYDQPEFDFDFGLLKALFEVLLVEYPITIDGDLDELYATHESIESPISEMAVENQPVQEVSDISLDVQPIDIHKGDFMPDDGSQEAKEQTTSVPLRSDSGFQDYPSSVAAEGDNNNMNDLWLSDPKEPSVHQATINDDEWANTDLTRIEQMDIDSQEFPTKANDSAPPITYKYDKNILLKITHHDKSALIGRGQGPFIELKSQRSVFLWKRKLVQRGNGKHLVELCGRHDLPSEVCLPGSTFCEFKFPYGTELLGPGNYLMRATIVAVSSPRTVFMHASGVNRDEFTSLSENMNAFYNGLSKDDTSYHVPDWFIYASFPCAICIDPEVQSSKREWERCSVVGADNDDVIIESVDYAGQRRVKLEELRLLPLKFNVLPVQSVRIKLMGIKEQAESERSWKKAKIRIGNFSLPNYELECAFYGRTLSSNDKPRYYEVVAFDRNDPDLNICVNDILVLESYAKYDENTIIEYQKKKAIVETILLKLDRPKYGKLFDGESEKVALPSW